MNAKRRPPIHPSTLVVLVAVVALSLVWVPIAQAAPSTAPASSGTCDYWYTVQRGDTWTKLSRRTGISVANLQAANSSHVHPPHHWLYRGHRLWIPCGGPPAGYWYTVQPGDTWTNVAARTGWSAGMLQRANTSHLHPPHYWLIVGHRLWIPGHVSPPPPAGYWYKVKPGDSWSKVAAKTGVPVGALQAANPSHMHPPYYWLYVGHKLWIPDP